MKHTEHNDEIKQLLSAARKLEIKARRLCVQHFIGDFRSAFRGSGLSFAEVRPYQYGDEVRNIDWNVTARTGQAHVKIFEEERESSMVIVFDNSASMFYGNRNSSKKELAMEIAAVIAFSAITANDRIGLLVFDSDNIQFIPPSKGKNQLTHILSTLIKANKPAKGKTRISDALEYLLKRKVSAENCFIISDFQSEDFSDALKTASIKYDLTGIMVEETSEMIFPIKGYIQFEDLETGEHRFLNQLFSSGQKQFAEAANQRYGECKVLFQRTGSELLKLETGKPYIPILKSFFKKRMK